MNIEEARIIERCKAHDMEAFDQLVDLYTLCG